MSSCSYPLCVCIHVCVLFAICCWRCCRPLRYSKSYSIHRLTVLYQICIASIYVVVLDLRVVIVLLLLLSFRSCNLQHETIIPNESKVHHTIEYTWVSVSIFSSFLLTTTRSNPNCYYCHRDIIIFFLLVLSILIDGGVKHCPSYNVRRWVVVRFFFFSLLVLYLITLFSLPSPPPITRSKSWIFRYIQKHDNDNNRIEIDVRKSIIIQAKKDYKYCIVH